MAEDSFSKSSSLFRLTRLRWAVWWGGGARVLSMSVGQIVVGLVVKASASRAEDPGFESRLPRDFYRVESYR